MKNCFYFIREAIPDNSDFIRETDSLREFLDDPMIDVEEYIRTRNAEEERSASPAF